MRTMHYILDTVDPGHINGTELERARAALHRAEWFKRRAVSKQPPLALVGDEVRLQDVPLVKRWTGDGHKDYMPDDVNRLFTANRLDKWAVVAGLLLVSVLFAGIAAWTGGAG